MKYLSFFVPHVASLFFLFTNIGVCSQDDLSNDIESLLEEVRNVQTRLTDLPDESLHAMEEGLRVSSTVYTPFYSEITNPSPTDATIVVVLIINLDERSFKPWLCVLVLFLDTYDRVV